MTQADLEAAIRETVLELGYDYSPNHIQHRGVETPLHVCFAWGESQVCCLEEGLVLDVIVAGVVQRLAGKFT